MTVNTYGAARQQEMTKLTHAESFSECVCVCVCLIGIIRYFFFAPRQHQQHADGHGEHGVQRPLHPGLAQRSRRRRRRGGGERPDGARWEVSELHLLLGSLSAAVSQQSRPGRAHQDHARGRAEGRGQCPARLFVAASALAAPPDLCVCVCAYRCLCVCGKAVRFTTHRPPVRAGCRDTC